MGQKIAHIYNLAVIKNSVFKIDVELSKLWFGHPYCSFIIKTGAQLIFECCAIFGPLYFEQKRNYSTAVPLMLQCFIKIRLLT